VGGRHLPEESPLLEGWKTKPLQANQKEKRISTNVVEKAAITASSMEESHRGGNGGLVFHSLIRGKFDLENERGVKDPQENAISITILGEMGARMKETGRVYYGKGRKED